MFRTLRADEIELRVNVCSIKGFSLLLYKDARCDENILDETVGAMNWQRHHSRDNANCIVGIWDESKKQWVEKEDTGTESYTEKEKGLASDSFKRACVNWGIGRELYSAPFIWINGHTEKNDKGKYVPEDNMDRYLYVSDIGYDEKRAINRLVIKDKNNKSVFSFKGGNTKNDTFIDNEEKNAPTSDNTANTLSEKSRPELITTISELISSKGLRAADIYKKIGVNNLSEIETHRLPGMIEWLEKMKGEK